MPTFDIAKATAKAKFTLEKKGIPSIRAAVVLNLDVSGSAKSLFQSGQMQRAAETIAPLAINLDDNQNLDIFVFADGDEYTNQIEPGMTAQNYDGFVKSKILDANIPLWGGTHYAQILKANLRALGFYKNGLFGGSKLVSDNGSGYPALIITLTDGTNYDDDRVHALLKETVAAKVNTYFLFVGLGNPALFTNIVRYGDDYPNVGFISIADLDRFAGSDDVYDQLLPQELVEWFKTVKK